MAIGQPHHLVIISRLNEGMSPHLESGLRDIVTVQTTCQWRMLSNEHRLTYSQYEAEYIWRTQNRNTELLGEAAG